MVGPVISILMVLHAQSLVPTAKNIERCPLFRARCSFCYAAEKNAAGTFVLASVSESETMC